MSYCTHCRQQLLCVLMHEQCMQLPHCHICAQEKVNMCPQKCSAIFVNINSFWGMNAVELQQRNGSANVSSRLPLQPNFSVGLVLGGGGSCSPKVHSVFLKSSSHHKILDAKTETLTNTAVRSHTTPGVTVKKKKYIPHGDHLPGICSPLL